MSQICRTCLQPIVKSNDLFVIDNPDSVQIKTKLLACVPELAIDLFDNFVLCSSCSAALNSAYDFKTCCLLTEQQIQTHIQAWQSNVKKFTLEEIYREIKQPRLTNPSNLADNVNDLVDDLNSLLDGVIQNQFQVLYKPNEKECSKTRNDTLNETLDIKTDMLNADNIREEDYDLSDTWLENDLDENVHNEEFELRSIKTKKCFVRLKKLSDDLVSSLLSQSVNKSTSNSFQCSECDYSCKWGKNFLQHLRIHSNERPFACHLCNFRSRHQHFVNQHMKIHQSLKFDAGKNSRTHRTNNNLDKVRPFNCKICDYKGPSKNALYQHMRTHNKDTSCNVCEKGFTCIAALTEHMSIHTGTKPFACHLCPFTTAYRYGLRAHLKKVHTKSYFSCNICKFRTVIKQKLTEHMSIHIGEKPFACHLCPFKSRYKGNLRVHLKMHTNNDFSCNICKFCTATKEKLTEHMSIHIGEKPFACHLCPFKSRYKSNLRVHLKRHQMLIHGNEKSFVCTVCNFRTTNKSRLDDHIQAHSGKKPYPCELCSASFTYSCNLLRHNRTLHQNIENLSDK